jgi:hypothetical protein
MNPVIIYESLEKGDWFEYAKEEMFSTVIVIFVNDCCGNSDTKNGCEGFNDY